MHSVNIKRLVHGMTSQVIFHVPAISNFISTYLTLSTVYEFSCAVPGYRCECIYTHRIHIKKALLLYEFSCVFLAFPFQWICIHRVHIPRASPLYEFACAFSSYHVHHIYMHRVRI